MQYRGSNKDLKNEFGWSFSRDRLFKHCERAFYWQYYGSWGGWEESAPKSAQIARKLKKLTTLPLLVGSVVHEVVGRAIRTRSERAGGVPLERLQGEADAAFERMYGESILFEHYYKLPLSANYIMNERQRMHALLDAFAVHPFAKRLFAMPKSRIVQADVTRFQEKKTFLRDTLIWANPDIVVFDQSGNPHIIDWKTGSPNAEDPSQLAVYALFVHLKHGIDIRKAVGHSVYLLNDPSVSTTRTLYDAIDEVDYRILRFAEEVKGRLTDVGLNRADDIERFPMSPDLDSCVRCSYQELCGRARPPVPF